MMTTNLFFLQIIKIISQLIKTWIDWIRNNIDTRFQGKMYACLTIKPYSASVSRIFLTTLTILSLN